MYCRARGFDLMIGNPPWIKIEWNEQGVLADANPMFAVKKLTAAQTTHERQTALENAHTHSMYFAEYEMLSGEQNFLNAVQNYPALKGQQTNLFKCFLPLSWEKRMKAASPLSYTLRASTTTRRVVHFGKCCILVCDIIFNLQTRESYFPKWTTIHNLV